VWLCYWELGIILTNSRKQQARRHDLTHVHYLFDTQAHIATINTKANYLAEGIRFHSIMPPKASSLPAG
jgi:hypothetical protein